MALTLGCGCTALRPQGSKQPSDKAQASLALETPCSVTNDEGTCGGMRACEPSGLSLCDAKVPAADICNGEDDNCNDEIDENACDDDNICTQDFCQPEAEEACIYSPNNGVICNDDDLCTLTDFCMDGVCTGNSKFCFDDNPCTDDACLPETGECDFTPNEELCDDGDPCTEGDTCVEGVCQASPLGCACAVDADCAQQEDGDLCNGTLRCDTSELPYTCVLNEETVILPCPVPEATEGINAPCLTPSCDPATGVCSFIATNEGGACDDGDACTAGETCSAGVCGNSDPVVCGDQSTCTTDTCDPTSGCVFTPIVAACDDGNPCTTGDACDDGICVSGEEVVCDDANPCTDDGCHPTDGCVHPPIVGACDDGDLCTTGDLCVDGECTSSGVLNCDDNNACTDEVCAPAEGCVTTFNTALCNDNNECTLGDQCSQGTCTGG
ncbi:MAG: hypothetical protein VX938_01890, partial [Myxococcota bacterium]|nr:hypothetical protein [Myxococcota bacterium]